MKTDTELFKLHMQPIRHMPDGSIILNVWIVDRNGCRIGKHGGNLYDHTINEILWEAAAKGHTLTDGTKPQTTETP